MTKPKSRKLKPETKLKKARAIDVELLSELEGQVIDFEFKDDKERYKDTYNGIVGRVGNLYVEMHCVSEEGKDGMFTHERRIVYAKDMICQFHPTEDEDFTDADTYRKLYEENKLV